MKKTLKIFSWAILVAVLAAAVFCGLGLLWLNTGHVSPLKQKLLSRLPAPVAVVGSRLVWSTEYFGRLEALRPYQPQGLDEQAYRETVYNRLLQEKAMDRLVSSLNAAAYKVFSGSSNTEKLLSSWQDKKTTLQIWYNGQEQLNPEAFQKAHRMEKLLADGTPFEQLAGDNSQEALSKTFNGDLGYLEAKDLLPEILLAADTMKAGEVRTIATRQGLHIIKLEGKDNLGQDNGQRVHLKQIFISESGFENWLDAEINKIKIIKLISI